MKSLLKIPLKDNVFVTVKKGEWVKRGTVIAKNQKEKIQENILLAKILGIKPDKIIKFLTLRIGSKVKKGDLIAKKDGIIKSIKLISPFSGILESVNLKGGTLHLSADSEKDIIIETPISGIIENLSSTEISISFEGKIIEGIKGKGLQVIGSPHFFDKDNIDLLDFSGELKGKIAIAKFFTESAVSKLNAIGAAGIISLDFHDEFPNCVKVYEKQIIELLPYHKRNFILLGDSYKIIVPL